MNTKINGVEVFPLTRGYFVSKELKLYPWRAYFSFKKYALEIDVHVTRIVIFDAERRIRFEVEETKQTKKLLETALFEDTFVPYSRMFNNTSWEEYKNELYWFLGLNSDVIEIK